MRYLITHAIAARSYYIEKLMIIPSFLSSNRNFTFLLTYFETQYLKANDENLFLNYLKDSKDRLCSG